MRSRPDLQLYLKPGEPNPGTRLSAQAVLTSRSETPIDGVEVHLTAREVQRVSGGNEVDTHTFLQLSAQTPAAVLTPGEHRFQFAFDLPPGVPPSYRSDTATIEYELQVRVSIPWWPDRTGRYLVPVAPLPAPAVAAPATLCTDVRGPQGSALYVEASVESTTIPIGGSIHGAVSFTNVSHHRIRRIELGLVQGERRRSSGGTVEAARYLVRLHEGAPPEGQSLPFHVALPAGAPTTFVAGFVEVRWYLEIRAVIALGSDVVLTVPFQVVRSPGGAPLGATPLLRVPPVGRERRALIWAESARRHGLSNDAVAERMTLELGAASLAITLEPRKAGGLALTAAVSWPSLGIELAVAERRWADAFRGSATPIDADGFADRFTARGREGAQVRAFLDEVICRWLLLFEEAAVGDEGATLVSSSAAQSLEELEAFVHRAVGAARALGESIARIPPPAAMTADLPAWRSFAALLGGRLVVGEMSILDAAFEEASLSVVTEWSKEAAPLSTVVRFPLAERAEAIREGEPPGAREEHLDGATRALVEGLKRQVTALDLGERVVEARLPAPLADPGTIEPVLAGLGRLVRKLSGAAARGPYR